MFTTKAKLKKALASLKILLAQAEVGRPPYTIKYIGGKETISLQMNQLREKDPDFKATDSEDSELVEQFNADLMDLPNNRGSRYSSAGEAMGMLDFFLTEYPAFKIQQFVLVDAEGKVIPTEKFVGHQTSLLAH